MKFFRFLQQRPTLAIFLIVVLFINVVALSAYFYVHHTTSTDKGLVLYYPFTDEDLLEVKDHAQNHQGFIEGDHKEDLIQNGYACFDGKTHVISVLSDNSLSPNPTRGFSLSIWVRPQTTKFNGTENKSYIQILGKTQYNNNEFALRIYNESNTENRTNRISFYVFNLKGGLGSGSYVQEPLIMGKWIHLVATIDNETVSLWKDGMLKDETLISDFNVSLEHGIAPLTIGTTDFHSYFYGCVDELRIYNRTLKESEIKKLSQDSNRFKR